MSELQPANEEKQPALRVPAIVLALLGVLLVLQLLMAFGGISQRNEMIVALGLFPARLFAEGLGGCPVLGCRELSICSVIHCCTQAGRISF